MNNIKEAREERDIKQKELAEKINIRQSTLSQYETEKREIPNEILRAICLELNYSADYILGLPNNLEYPRKEK